MTDKYCPECQQLITVSSDRRLVVLKYLQENKPQTVDGMVKALNMKREHIRQALTNLMDRSIIASQFHLGDRYYGIPKEQRNA